MKIPALEKEIERTSWEQSEKLIAAEALYVFQLYLSDGLREIYFTKIKTQY